PCRSNHLHVSRSVSLAPVLAATARPVGHAPLGEGAAQSLTIHPGEHQHLAAAVFLNDRGHEPVAVEAHEIEAFFDAVHRTSTPSSRMARLTSSMRICPEWNTVAARMASAPARTAGAKWLTSPAPPDAITGTLESSRIAEISSRSKPCLVPSASIEFTRSSPAP